MRRWLITALCIISVFACFCLCSFTVSAAVVEGGGGGTSSSSNGYLYLTEYKYTDSLSSFTATGYADMQGASQLSYIVGPSYNASDKDSLNYFQYYLGSSYSRWVSVEIDIPDIKSPLNGSLKQEVSVVVAPGSSLTWSKVSIKGVYSDGVEVVGTSSVCTIPNVNGTAYLLEFSYTAPANTELQTVIIDWEYNLPIDPGAGYSYPWFGISTIVIDNYADSKANAPIYQEPDDGFIDDYKDAEESLDGVVDDTVDGYENSFDDVADILVTEGGLGNAFLLIKSWLEDLLGISFFYNLVIVAITFGVMVLLINLGGSAIRHHRRRGD